MVREQLENLKIDFRLGVIFSAAILLSLIATVAFSIPTLLIANKKAAEAAEKKRPAKIEAIVIGDKSCADCYDPVVLLDQLEKENIKLVSRKTVDRMSAEGQALIKKYVIEKVPALILSGEISKEAKVASLLAQIGDFREENFIQRSVEGPFVITTSGAVKGRTSLTIISDVGCKECYDFSVHQRILKQFGLNPDTKIVDVNSVDGQKLIRKYSITMVPTFALTGDVASFPDLKSVWPQVGVVAWDGAYIFKKGVPTMGAYKDLKTGKVVTLAK